MFLSMTHHVCQLRIAHSTPFLEEQVGGGKLHLESDLVLAHDHMVHGEMTPRTSIPPYLRNSSVFKEFLLKIPP